MTIPGRIPDANTNQTPEKIATNEEKGKFGSWTAARVAKTEKTGPLAGEVLSKVAEPPKKNISGQHRTSVQKESSALPVFQGAVEGKVVETQKLDPLRQKIASAQKLLEKDNARIEEINTQINNTEKELGKITKILSDVTPVAGNMKLQVVNGELKITKRNMRFPDRAGASREAREGFKALLIQIDRFATDTKNAGLFDPQILMMDLQNFEKSEWARGVVKHHPEANELLEKTKITLSKQIQDKESIVSDLEHKELNATEVKEAMLITLARANQPRALTDKIKTECNFTDAPYIAIKDAKISDTYNESTENIPGIKVATATVTGGKQIAGNHPCEDRNLATSFEIKVGNMTQQISMVGIFDGHGGTGAADFVKTNIVEALSKKLSGHKELSDQIVYNALNETYVALNETFKKEHPNDTSGTLANVTLKIGDKVFEGNLGDSGTLVVSSEDFLSLSVDHKAKYAEVKESVYRHFGKAVETGEGRVSSLPAKRDLKGWKDQGIAVSHSIGDPGYQGLSSRPGITCVELNTIGRPILIVKACDGLYDVASKAEVAAKVQQIVKARPEKLTDEELLPFIAKQLLIKAVNAGSDDDITISVLMI